MDDNPGNSEAKRSKMIAMQKELRRLSRWSQMLCPFIWTSLDMRTGYQVRPGYRRWELDMIRIRFGEEMNKRNVSTPMQLRGWLKAVSTDVGEDSRKTVD